MLFSVRQIIKKASGHDGNVPRKTKSDSAVRIHARGRTAYADDEMDVGRVRGFPNPDISNLNPY
jgi:hypothetical protein